MHETAADLLDRSYAQAGGHLRGIFTPERRIPTEEHEAKRSLSSSTARPR